MSTLTVTPGETARWRIFVKDSAGAAQNLDTLSAAWLTIKQRYGDADPGVLQLTIGAGISVVNAATGELLSTASSAQTGLLQDGRSYWWDVRLKFADGTIANPDGLSGSLAAQYRITKATT